MDFIHYTSAENDASLRSGLTACAVLCMSIDVGCLHGMIHYGGTNAHSHGGVHLECLALNAKPRPGYPSRDQRGVFCEQRSHGLSCCFAHPLYQVD